MVTRSCRKVARLVEGVRWSMNIFVGNLSFSTTDDSLNRAFAQYGRVDSARVVLDRDTQRSRGFGFVEMTNEEEANNAVKSLDGTDLDGRSLRVNEARPRENRRPPRRY